MKILKFYADWCGPCKVLTKSFETAGVEHTPIDADTEEDMCMFYNVRNLPTVIAVDDEEKEIARFTGIKTANDLLSWVNSLNG